MKYLVNRETKEHVLYEDPKNWFNDDDEKWKVVEADSEGWIPWIGGEESPIPGGMEFKAKFRNGDIERSTGSHCYRWQHVSIFDGRLRDIIAYRPILTKQSEPEMPFGDKNLWIEESGQIEQSVFDRLASAVSASESIPALIAEINAMLPEGYMVARIGVNMAKGADWTPEPVEDMSDWRNWKPGDLVQRISPDTPNVYTKGLFYVVHSCDDGAIRIHDDCGGGSFGYFREGVSEKFKFHSRPTGTSK